MSKYAENESKSRDVDYTTFPALGRGSKEVRGSHGVSTVATIFRVRAPCTFFYVRHAVQLPGFLTASEPISEKEPCRVFATNRSRFGRPMSALKSTPAVSERGRQADCPLFEEIVVWVIL